jgi:hypothetical protein
VLLVRAASAGACGIAPGALIGGGDPPQPANIVTEPMPSAARRKLQFLTCLLLSVTLPVRCGDVQLRRGNPPPLAASMRAPATLDKRDARVRARLSKRNIITRRNAPPLDAASHPHATLDMGMGYPSRGRARQEPATLRGLEDASRDCCGTVFSITTRGTEQVLHSLGNSGDGYYPYASLIDVNGTHGLGTIYAITP